MVIGGFSLPLDGTTVVAVEQCLGAVRFEALSVTRSSDALTAPLTVVGSQSVALARCSISTTGRMFPGAFGQPYNGQAGIRCEGSSLALYDCTVSGANGGDGYAPLISLRVPPGFGGDGVTLVAPSTLMIAGGACSGGAGGNGLASLCCCNQVPTNGQDGARGGPTADL